MFKWYVTRGYPLQDLLDATYAERVLLRMAYVEYMEMLEQVGNKIGAAAEDADGEVERWHQKQ